MPLAPDGTPLISFGVEKGGDAHFEGTTTVKVRKGMRSCRQIASRRAHPELANRIARMNGIANPSKKLKIGREITVPDKLSDEFRFHVRAGDSAPVIVSGYAKIETIDRSERTGISVFTGYDPIVMRIPVRFEGVDDNNKGVFANANGQQVEKDIIKLERMAGRGHHTGAARGAPSIIRVSTTPSGPDALPWPLIPTNYQWTPHNTSAPLWWISAIDWDPDPIRNPQTGDRVRQLCDIELTQYVRPVVAGNVIERRKAATDKRKYDWGDGRGKVHSRPKKKR